MKYETITSRQRDAETIARLERLAARRAGDLVTGGLADGPAISREGLGSARVPRRRRPHPSKNSRVAALGLSLATTGGLTYAFASSTAGADTTALATALTTETAAAAPATVAPTTASPTTTTPTTSAPTTRAATAPTTATTATTAVKTVNGAVFTNKFGPVQVQASFAADGSLSAVNVIQLPTDRKSVAINNRAVPVLNREALAAQNAHVHTVSGATYTSVDYVKSLQSAIDTARASGITKLV